MLRTIVGVALVTSLAVPAAAENRDQGPKLTPNGQLIVGQGRTFVDTPRTAYSAPAVTISPYLYLNRCSGGCAISGASINDARTNQSTIPTAGAHIISEFQNAQDQTGAMADEEWNALVTCMKEVYSPFDVTVTDVKPENVSYTMAIVAGNPGDIGLDNSILGIAPLASDCSPQDNVISFSFANHHGNFDRVNNLCWTAAQETAHAFGLDHEYVFADGTSACNDPMTYRVDCGGQKFFRNKAASCGENEVRPCRCGGSQNSHTKIRAVFGEGTSIVPPPTVDLVSPKSGTITAATPFTVSAGSQRGIAKVEVWINNYMWAEKPGAKFLGAGQPNPSTYQLMLGVGARFGGASRTAPRLELQVVDAKPPPPPPVTTAVREVSAPDVDADGDHVFGALDRCPDRAEDLDGFQDDDGCPDDDDDGDGIADAKDACPREAETKNGIADDDGCPDQVPASFVTALTAGAKVRFAGKASLTPASKAALDKSLAAMLSNPNIKVAITAHPDSKDKDAADVAARRAEAVKWYLVEQGVAQAQLVTRIGAPVKAPATVIELAVAP